MRYIFTALTLLLFTSVTYAQGPGATPKVSLAGIHDDGKVILRWVPDDIDTWEEGMENGYTIKRYTTKVNGISLTEIEQLQSEFIIGNNIKPLTENVWDPTTFSDPELSSGAKQLLYSDEFNPTFTPSSLVEVVELNATKNNKFIFSLMLSDRDFEISEAYGLGTLDEAISDNTSYRYLMSFAGEDNVLSACSVDITDESSLPSINDLEAVGGNRVVILKWNAAKVRRHYTAYNIERSSNGTDFVQINDAPYVFGVDKKIEDDNSSAFYTDSIPNNDDMFYYRIKGLSPFGLEGPASEIIEVKGRDGIMELVISLAVLDQSPDEVTFIWDGIAANQESKVDFFDVYKSEDIYDGYIKVNGSQTIAADQRTYVEYDPLYSGYYMLTMQDINGHYYKSRPVLVQPLDTIPPEAPDYINGSASKDGTVNIVWSESQAADLNGYRVFRSNVRNGNYLDISSKDIGVEEYLDKLSTDMLNDSIFYRVKSTDLRGNHSDFSPVLGIARPNDIPPSNPVLYKVYSTGEGVKISWGLSESLDLTNQVLQRKPKDRSGWDNVIEISPGSDLENQEFGDGENSYNYIDDSELDQITYQYRLTAIDNYDNESSSKVIDVIPFFQSIVGDIIDFEGNKVCLSLNSQGSNDVVTSLQSAISSISSNPANTNTILLNLIQQGVITYNQYGQIINNPTVSANGFLSNQVNQLNSPENFNCKVVLDWSYEFDDMLLIKEVSLFVAKVSEEFELKKSYSVDEIQVSGNNMSIKDENLESGSEYKFKILIHLKDGRTSPMSEESIVDLTTMN